MFTWHKRGAMSGWNEKRIVNQSSADLAHAMPNVTHISNINPNVAHVAPHEARETSVIAPYVNNVMPIVTPETPQEKFLSSDALYGLRQISFPCLKVSSKQENAFVFRHPFTMLLAGPTSCGKTTWMKHLLQQAESMITPPPEKILWFYKRWQPAYTDLQETVPHIEFVQGIEQWNPDGQPTLYIYDDLMKDTTKNVDVCEMYTEGSHHCNLSVICLLQNLYHHGKENRTINLNTQYIVLFKNPRDQQQVAHLARQMYPNNSQSFLDAFRYATKEPYGYLLVDLKQDTADEDRLRTNIIKGVGKRKMHQLTSVSEQGNSVKKRVEDIYKMDKSQWSCIDCGIIFASTMDLQKHVKRGCPENDEPPMKRLCDENIDEPDESGWDNIVQRVYRKYDDQYSEKVESYEKEGYSEVESRQKATEDLFWKYRKGIMKSYADILTTVHRLKRSTIHQEVMEEIQTLMNENHYIFIQALKIVLRRNSSLFGELIDSEEEDDDDRSTDEESDSHTEEESSETDAESDQHAQDDSSETDGESDPHAQDESSVESYKTPYN